LYIVGIGPGALDHLTRKAYNAITQSQVIVGYKTYIGLISGLVSGKDIIASGMTQEVDRVRLAIEKALEGKTVCLISSGDAGIYGMAGIALEFLSSKEARNLEIEIVPGIMAATACASLLGAPLAHDFAVISLSDLLTDKRKIVERLKLAAKADFVIALYNPASIKRKELLREAWKILIKYKSPKTPVGIVKNAYRPGERIRITTLQDAPSVKDIDMFTTIIVGNSETCIKNGFMVTPRGYSMRKIKN